MTGIAFSYELDIVYFSFRVRSVGAAHKNREAPQSITIGDAPKSLDGRFPVLNFPNIPHLTANNKDFSLRSK